jgi:lipoprotein-releasing system ATP-binding protein
MVLEARNLYKSYRNGTRVLPVLTDLSLTVAKGEIVTIMGPSGSGKSTLLNIIGTLDRPDSGTVRIKEVLVTDMEDDELARVRNTQLGFVFQFHHLLPEFTAWENVLLPALLGGTGTEKTERARELFHYVNLWDRREHYPSQLSGGERLRVAVLRALINEPDLVLADEPTGNLDVTNAQRLLDLFLKIRDDFQQALVITTHNREVAEIGDRHLKLVDGKLEEREGV